MSNANTYAVQYTDRNSKGRLIWRTWTGGLSLGDACAEKTDCRHFNPDADWCRVVLQSAADATNGKQWYDASVMTEAAHELVRAVSHEASAIALRIRAFGI